MQTIPLYRKLFFIALSISFSLLLQSETTSAANGPNTNNEGVEVLTRGPIHEAFADVSVDEAQSGPVISRPVPDPINEIPPEFRPEGNQVTWIPGYWSWDEDQVDFIWVSGVWRDVPPGRQWIPGYWLQTEGGNQYISGYWTGIDNSRTEYLPPPPKPLEAGPNSPSSSPGSVWIEGNWIWSQNDYAWQTGYWHPPRPDMVWIPAHYVWTPRGYIFVMGYWDYEFDRRGLIFAPLYYPRPIYRNHGYFYSPSVVLDTDAVFLSLFVRNSRHYYFGDYYEPQYEKRGFRPWYSEHATRYGYDPFYRSYRSQRLQNDRQWENRYRQQFEYRRDHRDARPPQRFEPTRDLKFNQPHNPASQSIGRLFSSVVESNAQSKQFTHLNPGHEREFQSQSPNYKNFQAERRKFEMTPNTERRSVQPTDSQSPGRIKPSAFPIRSNPERTNVYVKPQDQPANQVQAAPQGQPRFNPQERTANQPQIIQQERRHPNPQEQPANQVQVAPQRQPRFNPQERTVNQPQIIQQERRHSSPQEQPANQVQVAPQRQPRFNPQERTANQPQIIQQERRHPKPQEQPANQVQVQPQGQRHPQPQEQTSNQPQGTPKGRNRQQPQNQNEGQPQDVPQQEHRPRQ